MFDWVKNTIAKFGSINDTKVPLTAKNISEWLDAGHPSNAGISIGENEALSIPAFKNAVDQISRALGCTGIHIYRNTSDGRIRDRKSGIDFLLNKKPNPMQNAVVWKTTMIKDVLTYGNGFSEIIRDPVTFKPTSLIRIQPNEVAVKTTSDGVLYYEFSETAQGVKDSNKKPVVKRVLAVDCFHIQNTGDGWLGKSVLHVLSDSLSIGVAQQMYASTYYKNQAIPAIAMTLQKALDGDEEQLARMRQSWNAIHSGALGAHKIAILEEGTTIEKLSVNPLESQMLEGRQFSIIDMANITGIPSNFLNSSINTSYKSLEHQSVTFLRAVNYWLCQFETEVDCKLLSNRQIKLDTHYAEFNRSQLVEVDITTRNKVLMESYHGGAISWEQLREKNNESTDQDDGFFLRPNNLQVETFQEPEEIQGESVQVSGQEPNEVQDDTQGEETQEEESKFSTDERLTAITKCTVERMFGRIEKASQNKDATWLETESFDSHLAVFYNNLESVASRSKIVTLLNDIKEELKLLPTAEWLMCFSQDKDRIVKDLLCK